MWAGQQSRGSGVWGQRVQRPDSAPALGVNKCALPELLCCAGSRCCARCWLTATLSAADQFLNLLAQLLVSPRLFISLKMETKLTETSYWNRFSRWFVGFGVVVVFFLMQYGWYWPVLWKGGAFQESKPPSSSTAGFRSLPSWKQVAGDRDAFGQCFHIFWTEILTQNLSARRLNVLCMLRWALTVERRQRSSQVWFMWGGGGGTAT